MQDIEAVLYKAACRAPGAGKQLQKMSAARLFYFFYQMTGGKRLKAEEYLCKALSVLGNKAAEWRKEQPGSIWLAELALNVCEGERQPASYVCRQRQICFGLTRAQAAKFVNLPDKKEPDIQTHARVPLLPVLESECWLLARK